MQSIVVDDGDDDDDADKGDDEDGRVGWTLV